MRSLCLAVVFVASAALCLTGAEPERRPFGLEKRTVWTTSRLTGTPEAPPPFRTERVFPNLKFAEPVTIARAPGMDRLFIMELRGKIFSFPDSRDAVKAPLDKADFFADLATIKGHWRSYGLVFHPRFAENRQVFVCYVLKTGNPKGSRVSRFTVTKTDPPTLDLQSEQILIDWPSGGHNGGCLAFGPDGYLYISTGDGSNPSPPDALNTGQDLTDLLASILRIDVDRPAPGKGYAVPADNPFVKVADARPEIWAYGLRNPWKMAFDDKSGDLWVGDVGWEVWEMIYRVVPGGNYGWSVAEGKQPVHPGGKRGPTPILAPTVDHDHTEARSITGGRVYHGKRFKDLQGAYIYGDYVTGKLWGLRHDGTKVTWQREIASSTLEIIDFGTDKDGELYILEHGGTIHRLAPSDAKLNAKFPRRLSETGLFASVKEQTPAPGVLPYSISAEPWADHAVAERFFAMPGTTKLGVYEKQNLQIGWLKGAWIYPTDTVFARTVSLDMERGNPATRRRLETQVLHQAGDTWRAYNYLWNEDQTDALLAGPEGSQRSFTIKDGAHQTRQTWTFASRTECLICHTTRAGSILGFNQAQLNRDHVYGNRTAPQLATLEHVGYFENAPAKPPRMASPWDERETLNDRARAYLHTNCAHCHRRGGGGTAPFELLYEMDLKKLQLVGTAPTQGTFDIPDARNVAAGEPFRSVLYYRMAKLGRGRMPYSGTNLIDEKGLALVHDWISQLDPAKATPNQDQLSSLRVLARPIRPDLRQQMTHQLLGSTPGALSLLRALDMQQIGDRKEVIALATAHPQAQIRDLFERFVPEEDRVKRLGTLFKPADILNLAGEAERGRRVFFQGNGVQCKNCHRIQKEGIDVGPDLSLIGKKYNREQLLESIVEPSKNIEPAYVTHLVATSSGAVHTGLLVRKSDAEVVLKDGQGKILTIPAADVESMGTQRTSLMPDLLLRDMTPQEAADLLAFLASLK